MKTAIYSGSFNPVHLGHIKLSKYLIDNNIVDEVWFVVSPCNPLKKQQDLLDEYLRLDMLILAIKDQPSFKASDIEFTMPIPSYTIDTLNLLRREYPEREFCLIIGSDNALVFDQWKNYQEILDKYDVLVYPRDGYNFDEVINKYPTMRLLDTPFYQISSTDIRNSIAKNQDVSGWLHPAVLEFIQENSLYKQL